MDTVHPAVRRSAGLRLPLLRPHCHLRLPQRAVAARAGGALLPSSRRRSGGQQGVLSQRTADYQNWVEAFARNHRIPIEWAEKGVRKEDHVLPWQRRMAQGRRLRRLLHLQEHGAGADLSRQRAEIPHQGSQLPHPRPPAQPLHPLLLLHPRRNPRPDGDAGGLVLPVPDHLLPQRPQLHRAGAQPSADRLPQERQRLPRGRRRGRAAGRRRPAEPGDHPRAARLLDLDPGPEVLRQGAQAAQPVALLCDRPDRVLPQLHLQAQLSHPQTVRAQLRARPVAADRRQDRRRSSAPA